MEREEELAKMLTETLIDYVRSCPLHDLISMYESVMPESEESKELKELTKY